MIDLEDRQTLAREIEAAHQAGARLRLACEVAGIDVRTLQRWKAHEGLVSGDGRPDAIRPTPAHALTPAEREQILHVANEPRFADMPAARIVPMLADAGVYVASESSLLPSVHRLDYDPSWTMSRRAQATLVRPRATVDIGGAARDSSGTPAACRRADNAPCV